MSTGTPRTARTSPSSNRRARWTVGVCCALFAAGAGLADDRDLFSLQGDQPYVFTIMDTSGSMNWTAGQAGSVWTDMAADSPDSRLYQAKAAIYEVIQGLNPGIRLGFAHFEQENMRAWQKHWAYARTDTNAVPWFGNANDRLPWPAEGERFYLGPQVFDGNDGRNDNSYGWCDDWGDWFWRTFDDANQDTIDVRDRMPIMGPTGNETTRAFVVRNGNGFRITYSNLTGSYGDDTLNLTVQVERLTGGGAGCSWNNLGTATFTLGQFRAQDTNGVPFVDAAGDPLPNDFMPHYRWTNFNMNGVCGSDPQWAPNDTPSTGYQNPDSRFRYTTAADPLGRDSGQRSFHRGEVVPWDWIEHPVNPASPATGFEVSSRDEILRRLAPNTSVPGEFAVDADGQPIPDFRIARYFEDVAGGDGRLDVLPQFQRYPPFLSANSTPIAGAMNNLADWYEDWEPIASDDTAGDPAYICREQYLILLTDGDETCGGNPPAAAARLRNLGIRTFVIAFGGGIGSSDRVQAIADAGGTGEGTFFNSDGDCEDFSGDGFDLCPGPIVAADGDELVAALQRIFGAIETRPRAFSSAATSPSRTDDGNSIFLSSFLPIPDQAVWSGSLTHFLQPLPTTTDDDGNTVPDTSRTCGSVSPQRSCLAWDAGVEILDQAPAEITLGSPPSNGDFLLGNGANRRRVFYSRGDTNQDSVPLSRPFFGPTENSARQIDQIIGLGIDGFDLTDSGEQALAYDLALDSMVALYQIKVAPDPRDAQSDGSVADLEWVLGDIFHSSPRLVGAPRRSDYLISDLNGYQEFFRRHRNRRRVMSVAANDGLLHFFDAGSFEAVLDSGRVDLDESNYGFGTGRELFAVVPRAVMPTVREVAEFPDRHDFRADGELWYDDVFIDPDHNGTPTAADREWRSVVIAGLREGGRGYTAIDITQPDGLEEKLDTFGERTYIPLADGNYVPDCIRSGTGYSEAKCGPIEYGSILWEFTAGDDPTLQDTWSTPRTGRVRISDGAGGIVERFVMIVGGGIDPADWAVGNALYMIDVETGAVLLKRTVDGGVPSDIAIVSRSSGGFVDTLYFGTLGGKLYKVDLSAPAEVDGATGEIVASDWQPFVIYDTATASAPDGRPIFFQPSVVRFEGGTSLLVFGTGNREDLWDPLRETQQGRMYVLQDDFFTSATGLTDDDLQALDPDAPSNPTFDPIDSNGGYYFTLQEGEKLLAPAFTLAGLTVFSTFNPLNEATTINGEVICETTGFTRVFLVFVDNGNAIAPTGERYQTVEGVVSSPFTGIASDQTGAGDDDGNGGGGDTVEPCDAAITAAIQSRQPADCRFNNLSTPIYLIDDATGVSCVASFPICLREDNWGDNLP